MAPPRREIGVLYSCDERRPTHKVGGHSAWRQSPETAMSPTRHDQPEGPLEIGGDYVGGNKTITQHAGGDIVGRDKITTTTITNGLSANQFQQLAAAFAKIHQQIDARPPDPNVEKDEIKRAVDDVQTEVQKGEAANPTKVERWLANLRNFWGRNF